jgi:hypothetical protein
VGAEGIGMIAREVFEGSDGELTKRYYAELEKRGPLGVIAMNLFRAQKASARAKVYRGGLRGVGSFKRMAYDKKQWSIEQLAAALFTSPVEMKHGWKQDPTVVFDQDPSWVFYVELPMGQVSFHSPTRGKGPDYSGDWDGQHKSEERILRFCDSVYHAPDERQERMFA